MCIFNLKLNIVHIIYNCNLWAQITRKFLKKYLVWVLFLVASQLQSVSESICQGNSQVRECAQGRRSLVSIRETDTILPPIRWNDDRGSQLDWEARHQFIRSSTVVVHRGWNSFTSRQKTWPRFNSGEVQWNECFSSIVLPPLLI